MNKKIWNIFYLLALPILITACSTATVAPPAPDVAVPTKERQTALGHVQSWRLKGKIAVIAAKDSGSATIDWQQTDNHFAISLFGPVGTNNLKLSGQPGRVSMLKPDGKRASASTPEELLAQQWGWHVPVSNIRYWIRGMPVPGSAAKTQYDSYGRISGLSQSGYQVRYLSYTKSGGVDLPSRVDISSASLKVKIMVYQWNV